MGRVTEWTHEGHSWRQIRRRTLLYLGLPSQSATAYQSRLNRSYRAVGKNEDGDKTRGIDGTEFGLEADFVRRGNALNMTTACFATILAAR